MAAEPGVESTGLIQLPHLTIRFDGAVLKASAERLVLTDSRMRTIWGDALWRIALRATQPMSDGLLRLSVSRS